MQMYRRKEGKKKVKIGAHKGLILTLPLKRIHVILIALRPSSVHRFVGINGLCFLKPLDEASYEFLIDWVVDPSGAK